MSEKYNKEKYEDIRLRVYSGQKKILMEYAKKRGVSVNGLINRLIASEIRGFKPID